jgi:UDP-glucose 4-epimerase
MKIVITGGAGFIGSTLAGELVEKHDVTVIDDLSTGQKENLNYIIGKINFIKGSITDLDLLRDAFMGVDTVFHQAAITSVQRSIDHPLLSNEVNLDGTLKVLAAARDCGVKKVIFASSSSVYGDTPTLPKAEDMKPHPESPYAVSKLAGEYYCRIFSKVYGLRTACLRYFNVYGPRQNPCSENAAVIPRSINRVLKNEPPIIYGDGNQTRDFIYVKDVAKANILAMDSAKEGIFNIASGQGISVNDLIANIMIISGSKLKPFYDKPRKGDVRDSLADISAAKEGLGYEPSYNFISGLKETIGWFQGNDSKTE